MDFPTDEQALAGLQAEADLEQEEQRQADTERQAARLQMLGGTLAARRDEWIAARASAGHDSRWVEDLDQFNGKDAATRGDMMTTVEQGGLGATTAAATQAVTRSKVFVQVSRQKTNAAAARLADVVLPTDEQNYKIEPTAIPRLPKWLDKQTQPAQAAAGAAGGPMPPMPGQPPMNGAPPQAEPNPEVEAKTRAEAMNKRILDALGQCDYHGEVRKVIFNAALLGTGVLKGPVVINRMRRAWRKTTDMGGSGMWMMEMVEELSPASFSVDPRNVYPDPGCGDNVQNGRGIFEAEPITPKQVRDLRKQPGYLEDQIRSVLEEGPTVSKRRTHLGEKTDQDNSDEVYEKWIYWGEIDREDLEAAGVEIPEDDLQSVSACVEMINSTVVRAYLNPLADGALPYDFFPWELVADSVWGYGVPTLMRSQQRVINAAWRMLLDNAGVSSGPQIVIKPGVITPADKTWQLAPRKIWYAQDDVDDVRKAFTTFEFSAHQAELQAIVEMAEKLSDSETAVPMLAQGQQGTAPETVGGMQMLMNSANVVLKRLVKQFDDRITKPHIRRYYSYLMEYDEDEAIKGDFSIVALGSSALVVRDLQNQAISNLLGLAQQPSYAPLINLKKLFEKALKAEHIDPVDVMNTDAEIEEAQKRMAESQGPDPRVAAAEMRSKADMQRTQAQVVMNQRTIEAKQNIAGQDRAMRLRELEIERDIELLRVSQKTDLTVQQIKAQLATVAIKERARADQQANTHHMQQAQAPKKPPAAKPGN